MKLTENDIELIEDIRRTVTSWGIDCRWTALLKLVDRFIQEQQPEQKIQLSLTDREQQVIEQSKDWMGHYKCGVVFAPYKETCQIICNLLLRIEKVAQESEPPQPEVKFIKTGMELTSEEVKAKEYLLMWAHSRSIYGEDRPVANVYRLISAIDREAAKHIDYKKDQRAAMPRVVIYDYGPAAIYVDGELAKNVGMGYFSLDTAQAVLIALGYEEAKIHKSQTEDMPRGKDGLIQIPQSLAELEDHFKNLEQARRRTRIASLKDELQRLEQEDAKR